MEELTSLEIIRIGVRTWTIVPNGIAADNRNQSLYNGSSAGDLVTIKSFNGGVEFKNIPFSIIKYTDNITPANNRNSFASAQEFDIYAKNQGFFYDGGSGTGGATSFDELIDTPNSKLGNSGKAVVVGESEIALEYVLIPIINDSTDIGDFPQETLANKYLKRSPDNLSWILVDGIEGTQNNIGKKRNYGTVTSAPTTAQMVTAMNAQTTVINDQETPILVYMVSLAGVGGSGDARNPAQTYTWIFMPGKGTYGSGGTTVTSSMLYQLPVNNLTPDDIDPDYLYNLDPVIDGDFVSKANQSVWDFSDSTYPESGINYYFSYTDDGVLYYALFVGNPGNYGSGGTAFTESDFVTTTNGNIDPDPNNFLKLTGETYQAIDGGISVDDKYYFRRGLDNSPEGWVGYTDTEKTYELTHNAGGGGSYHRFTQNNEEIFRTVPETKNLLIGTTVDSPDVKLKVEGNGLFSGNAYADNFSNLRGKAWCIWGDSFSSDIDDLNVKYPNIVIQNLGVSAESYAVSGNTSAQQLAILKNRLISFPDMFDVFDIVSLHIGVNDFANSTIPLGTMNSVIGDGSVAANVKEFIETVLEAKSSVKFFLISPPEADQPSLPFRSTNEMGWRLQDLSNLFSQIGMYYSVQVIDLYSISQFNPITLDYFTYDRLHPNNPAGVNWIGDIVSQAFLANSNHGREVSDDRVLHTSGNEYKKNSLDVDNITSGKNNGNGEIRIYKNLTSIDPNYLGFTNPLVGVLAGIYASAIDKVIVGYNTSNGGLEFTCVPNQNMTFKNFDGDDILIIPTSDTGVVESNKRISHPDAINDDESATLGQINSLTDNFVKLTGNQTVAGVKTFSSSPIIPIATTNFQAIPLAQVNTLLGSYIKQSGNSFGAPVSIGSLDDNMVRILVNSLASVKFSANQMDVGGFGGYKIINGTTEINISVGFTRLTATPVNGSTTPAHTFRKVSSANTVVDIVSYFGGSSGNTVVGGIKDDGSTYTVADFESTTASKGVILKSPNGTRYRITVSDTGVLTTTAI